ncbi:MAG: hypothetical protein ACRENB_11805 [Gemmatimonadales bacterium]
MARRAGLKAVVAGTILQLGMVAAGHLLPGLQEANLYPFIGTGIGALTAFWYGAASAGSTLVATILRGALAGGLAATLGATAAVTLGQIPPGAVVVAAGGAIAVGLFGAALGKLLSGAPPEAT